MPIGSYVPFVRGPIVEWYVNGARGLQQSLMIASPPAYGYGVVTFDVPLPVDPALVGFTFSTQGAGFGGSGGTTLHNAYDLFVGH